MIEEFLSFKLNLASLIILGLLILSTLFTYLLKISGKENQELKQRIKSWWLIITFYLGSLYLHQTGVIVLFGLVSYLALKEYFTLIHTRFEDHRALLWSYLIIPVQYYLVASEWDVLAFIFIPVYVFLFIPFRLILTKVSDGILNSMSQIQWGLMAFVYALSHFPLLFTRPPSAEIELGGPGLFIYLMFLTASNDIAQFIWGKTFGKNKITPISPNKTWEGFFGGVLTTIALAHLMNFLCGFNPTIATYAGLLIACSGFIGDLVISSIKRDIGVKDSGTILPGHGGILDRIDSLVYTAPLFFHFVNYIFY